MSLHLEYIVTHEPRCDVPFDPIVRGGVKPVCLNSWDVGIDPPERVPIFQVAGQRKRQRNHRIACKLLWRRKEYT